MQLRAHLMIKDIPNFSIGCGVKSHWTCSTERDKTDMLYKLANKTRKSYILIE